MEPLCVMCLQENRRRPAEVVDHVRPHHGDPNSFILGELQSLCRTHHNSSKQRLEKRGFDTRIGPDGTADRPQAPDGSESALPTGMAGKFADKLLKEIACARMS
jgi:hypothetical protein